MLRRAMGKLIEFKYPTPSMEQIVGPTLTENPPNGEKTTASKAEFDAQVEEERQSPKELLSTVLEHADDVLDILIMVRDVEGGMGVVSNVESFEETLAFIERIKYRMLNNDAEDAGFHIIEGT